MPQGLRVGIVGATGAVGQELIRLLEERSFPCCELRLMASARSAGKVIRALDQDIPVVEADSQSVHGLDVVFFCSSSQVSQSLAKAAVDGGALVVDNSSAFRMDPDVPLVIPEVNIDAVKPEHKIVANPNCSTIVMLMAAAPLTKFGAIQRIVASTYQAVSGAGAAAMQELLDQTKTVLEGGEAEPSIFDHACAFNVFSHDTPVGESGFNVEEEKMAEETKKIMGQDDLEVAATCIRVPVLRAHSESLLIEFKSDAPREEDVLQAFADAPGIRVVDDRASGHFPMPLEAGGADDVLVGRIRRDPTNPKGLLLFVSGDQIRKGAALNALQIAEALL